MGKSIAKIHNLSHFKHELNSDKKKKNTFEQLNNQTTARINKYIYIKKKAGQIYW